MAKDNRRVVNAVRIAGHGVVKDEDRIAELLSAKDGQRLVESGALSGDWDFGSTSNEGPQLTAKTSETLQKADVEIGDGLRRVSDDDLKAAGLAAAQIKNVRAVYGE